MPSPSAFVKKFLLIADKNNHDIKVPKHIKKEFFQLDETFLMMTNQDVQDGINMVRKTGRHDSFIYSNEVRYVKSGERIQRKKQKILTIQKMKQIS